MLYYNHNRNDVNLSVFPFYYCCLDSFLHYYVIFEAEHFKRTIRIELNAKNDAINKWPFGLFFGINDKKDNNKDTCSFRSTR